MFFLLFIFIALVGWYRMCTDSIRMRTKIQIKKKNKNIKNNQQLLQQQQKQQLKQYVIHLVSHIRFPFIRYFIHILVKRLQQQTLTFVLLVS